MRLPSILGLTLVLSFLDRWDGDHDGQVYQMTFNHCFGAKVDVYTTEDARRALAGFCRITGIAARDMPHAVMVDVDGEVRAQLS